MILYGSWQGLSIAAEDLVLLAVAQVVRPGTPIVATSLQFSGDMRTGRSLQSSVESLRQSTLFPQLMQDAFKHCRNVETSINFTRQDQASWASAGSRNFHERVREYLRDIMKDAEPIALPRETCNAFSEIVKMADDKMC